MSIKTVQQKLQAAGFDPGPIDGEWGPRTEFALDAALSTAHGYVACDIDPDLRKGLAADLERDEGRVSSAYTDHLGYWTIGVGRLIDKRRGGKISDDEIDYLLDNDIRASIASVADLPSVASRERRPGSRSRAAQYAVPTRSGWPARLPEQSGAYRAEGLERGGNEPAAVQVGGTDARSR